MHHSRCALIFAIPTTRYQLTASDALCCITKEAFRLLCPLAYPERGRGIRGFKPPSNLQNFMNSLFAKYTVKGLLLYSLNPKFYTGKR